MSAGSDVWGYITGVISILALICQLVRMNLPSSKLRKFDSLLHETEDLLQETDEEGWLGGGHFVQETKVSLGRLREAAQPLRSRVHKAKTISQQCLGTFTGLSSRLSVLCYELKELKAEIATKTDEAKDFVRKRRLEHQESNLMWQKEHERIAPKDQDSFDGSRGSGSEGENMTLMGVESDEAWRERVRPFWTALHIGGRQREQRGAVWRWEQALTHDEDTTHRVIEPVKETCNTTLASYILSTKAH